MAKIIIHDLLQIFKSSVFAVLPENLIRKSLNYNRTTQDLTVLGETIELKNKNVYLVGTGKAVQNMAKEVEAILGSKIKQGIISIPVGSLNHYNNNNNILYCEGAKDNLPDTNAESTAKNVCNFVTRLQENDLLLVLISGGGSALLPLPKEPITLEEKTELIKNLANSGADIIELNTVRKKLSDLKGGELATKAQPAKVVSLILSDIVGDPLDLIASGPTTENIDDPSKAIDIIHKYQLFDDLPTSIKKVLQEYNKNIFPKDNVKNYIIGSNKVSISAALEKAMSLNYLTIALSNSVTGNVRDIALKYTSLTQVFCEFLNGKFSLKDLKSKLSAIEIPTVNINFDISDIKNKDVCLILGGETTVQINGKGKGGRNQQLALEFSNFIHNIKDNIENFDVHFLSAGTDGIDGPTDAAGAIGYLDLKSDTQKNNINIQEYIDTNNSYNFYRTFKDGNYHIITGHTCTNVMDIHLILIKKKRYKQFMNSQMVLGTNSVYYF